MGTSFDFSLLDGDADGPQLCTLEAQAARCRRLAYSLSDARTIETLAAMAAEYDRQAAQLRG